MAESGRVEHEFPPVFDKNSKILILGSFPSVKSREQQFYYGHPQNRFWRLLAAIFEAQMPQSAKERRKFIISHNIALWDVIGSCEITGSADSSIKNVKVNDISIILDACDIRKIFINGNTAFKLYEKYLKPLCGVEAVKLPSTSPANAAWNFDRLYEEWKCIRTLCNI